jgi:flagellar biosynthetic protein FliP
MEVVQRVALGPKMGLAVVRIGEKVVAVSIGDGGIQSLFELDEADRQRVLATSQIAVPMRSSPTAAAHFPAPAADRPMLPGKFGAVFSRALSPSPSPSFSQNSEDVRANTAALSVQHNNKTQQQTIAPVVVAPFTLTERAEIPSFLTAPLTTSRGAALTYARSASLTSPTARPTPRPAPKPMPAPMRPPVASPPYRSRLSVSRATASRLVTVVTAMLMLASTALSAQGAPPATAQGTPPAAPPAAPPVTPPAAPPAPTAPTIAPRPGQAPNAAARLARPAAAAATTPRVGNGASTTPQGTAASRPMMQMVVDTARPPKDPKDPKAESATPATIAADDAIMRMMPQMDVKMGGDGETGGLRLNGTVGIVVMMGLLTLLPTLLLMMTGFTRILIVLHFLKQAMGTQSAPPGHLLAGLALLLTGFVMTPTLSQMNREAITPWLDGKITQVEMMKTGVVPMRAFMVRQTRESDIAAFVEMSRIPSPATVDDVPLHVLMSAFVASELRTAFQIGFAIYLPFIIVDAVVASVLMSMGMMMLPPAMISLPFKLLLFVLVDGWSLTITSLVQSFK